MARASWLFLAAVAVCSSGIAQESSPGWQSHALPFRPLNITSVGRALWVCGTDEAIAVSLDDGRQWKVVRREVNGRVLLNIAFADARFGYAAGSNGLLLVTTDGGSTWAPQTTTGETILQAAFGDPRHGLIRTPSGLMFTADGAHWSRVPMQDAGADLARFRYTFALAALDGQRLAIVLKDGPRPSYSQAFVVTTDGGATWKFSNGPDAILAGVAAAGGNYWAVGQETVGKKNGGRSVPLALYSSDGQRWNRSRADLSVCQEQGCAFCTGQGCLAANGTLADVFHERTSLRQFPPNDGLAPAWAATDTAICVLGGGLECASLEPVKRASGGGPLPAAPVLSQPPLGSAVRGPLCLVGGIDPSLLASNGYGSYKLQLTFRIAPNGTVESVDVAGAPVPAIADRVRRRVLQWIFEPTITEGVARSAEATTSLAVDVRSR